MILILFLGLLIAMGFVSSVETALLGVPFAKLRLALEHKEPSSQRFRWWLKNPGHVLTTLHFMRLCFIVIAGIVALRIIDLNGALEDIIIAIAVALLALLIGHIIPRSLAKRRPYEWAKMTLPIVWVFTLVLFPITAPFCLLVSLLGKISGQTLSSAYWTPEELDRMHAEARTQALGKPNEELFKSILEFSDTVIKEIMVPRTEMVAVSIHSTTEELLQTVLEVGHSRIPIYEDTIDNIVGLLHVKELFAVLLLQQYDRNNPSTIAIDKLLKPTFYVPEVMQISELLREFQKRKTHMAIAVDEYGGTSGCVTLEDIIEEIVGEIQDEYDVEEKQFRILSDNKIIADAKVHVGDLEKALNVEFPDDDGFETLAGFIMSELGYIPQVGSALNWKNLRFTIKEANERRIGMVEIERK